MRMTLYNSLHGHHQRLTDLYTTHIEAVHALQKTFLEQVLPDISFDMSLSDHEEEYAKQYINDTCWSSRVLVIES